ncbi:CDP-diacylglycerol--glycerol-3-phosphate 3-phosphatidyltransferase [Xylocopilactobacillus apicola]|uniref:CDP-diacylglycerol--glycerol-3-phosphate 3-phosphatidyltransferase n=1 Tax=Xylocopilactobacillus apicola TaxID=2932184 RepID=A0AAU9DNY9_9LACO|nr:CDP-diacylglycerol--glycerol-3-phosphate 3-phosphatidyltransferase [Xylocopilactobacillus apicola]BDR58827.1 CDP-diacylglycerol--glycerol-3-phosphate 3-phosphatidyltransferase [Xylocopilactobacillus apicola]
MNLPNKLTLFRIFLIPFYTVLLCLPSSGKVMFLGTEIEVLYLIATIIFVVASITDFLDGQIARRNNLVTNFGKFADPLADKLLVITAFIFLAVNKSIPTWGLAIIVWRELSVTGLRLLLANHGEVVAAALPGKIKTFSQMISIIFLNLNNVGFAAINFPFAQIMFYIALFFTVYSGIEYFYKNRGVFADSF